MKTAFYTFLLTLIISDGILVLSYSETEACSRNSDLKEAGGTTQDERVCTKNNNNECSSIDSTSVPSSITNSLFCPKLNTKPLPKRKSMEFIFQDIEERDVYVFSAFYERRTNAGGPAVRSIAIGLQAEFNDIGSLYCQMLYNDTVDDARIVSVEAVYERIYPSTFHHDAMVSHFILCKLPEVVSGTPISVSVTPEKCSKDALNSLRVLDRDVNELPSEPSGFALCYPVFYNNFQDWRMIIEMLELHRLLGVDSVTLYLLKASDEVLKVLNNYVKEGFVKIIPWPFRQELYPGTFLFAQRAFLNDCLYRNINHFRYISVNDLDEVIVPRQDADTWSEMMELLPENMGAYIFQHAYYRRNKTQASDFITQTSFWRTDKVVPAGKVRSKTIYNGRKALKVDVHSPYELVPHAREIMVDPNIGMLHHYRKEPMESFRKHPENYNFIEDRHLVKYQSKLEKSFNKYANIP